ncbi:MAG TPA: PadR family transcriptional regulator [Cytophagales bacterium]|nr:PadR family transcriptional regulator [Cytophagales bacterium]HAA19326.1 PadR family transcriptional regulator [Cytophagales bacterium]HAP61285.1 PadR family transcriptional regulator [Cytophagales bacterium]
MKASQLGEFEEIVLLTVGILHGNAYGVTIRDEIEEQLGRSVTVGGLQTTLKRLESKGLLAANTGDGTEIRAGRPKLYFTLTLSGKKALDQSREARDKLWNALPQIILNLK